MDDEPDKLAEDADERGPLCGERLAAAREELQISVDEIAKELHLDEHKVMALERNEFAPLGAPVFAKGHLRKYAHLVKVDESDVLTDYHRLTREEGLPPVISDRKVPKLPASPRPWIAAGVVLVIVLAAVAAYWFMERRATGDSGDSGDTVTTTPAVAVTETAASVPPATAAEPDADDSAGELLGDLPAEVEPIEPIEEDPQSAPVAAAAPLPQATAPETADDGQLRLSIDFAGDCWTEITDADGRRLFFDLGREGRSVNVSGSAPLAVLFGNADNVRLKLNGVDYTIPDADRRGLTARFTLFPPQG